MIWNNGSEAFTPASSGNGGRDPRDDSGPLRCLGGAGGLLRELQSIHIARLTTMRTGAFLGFARRIDVRSRWRWRLVAGWGVLEGRRNRSC